MADAAAATRETHESNPINDATAARGKLRVPWYRCPVPREELGRLNRRSDLLGFAQTLGYLGVIALNAALALYSFLHWPWYVTALLVYWNSMCVHFHINAFHELIHDSVFKTRWLNGFFLRIFSFLGWYNHHHFWASHTEHHKYTLHPPDDGEVVLPQKVTLRTLIYYGIFNFQYPWVTLCVRSERALGWFPDDQWSQTLFPESDANRRRQFINWERVVLIGHLAIATAALVMGWWIVILLVTFPHMMGSWLHTLCNSSQHIGLSDNTPDYRLCCRTIYLNPFLQFLYWHMNYHTEHHMYAAVPCYKLGRLHRLIRHDMPHCPNGLVETWTQIFSILERQKTEPDYQYAPQLPSTGRGASVRAPYTDAAPARSEPAATPAAEVLPS